MPSRAQEPWLALTPATRRKNRGSSGLDDRLSIMSPWSPTQGKEGHGEAIRITSARQASRKERTAYALTRQIDFSDIPELSDEQLRTMRRVGRPPIGAEARQFIAIRLDPEVLTRFRAGAKRLGIGYQTLMHRVLAAHVGARAS